MATLCLHAKLPACTAVQTYLTYLPVHLSTHLPSTYLTTYLPTYLPACLPACVPACVPACLPGYLDMLENWAASLVRLHLHRHFMVLAQDEGALEFCQARWPGQVRTT